jgi:hypothetical protein
MTNRIVDNFSDAELESRLDRALAMCQQAVRDYYAGRINRNELRAVADFARRTLRLVESHCHDHE